MKKNCLNIYIEDDLEFSADETACNKDYRKIKQQLCVGTDIFEALI